MRNGILKIPKAEWYRLGGFARSDLFRKADSQGRWGYYIDTNHTSF